MMVVIAEAGTGALHLVVRIYGGIVDLDAILVLSYRQVIEAYPGGGGAYAVALDNFGPSAGLLAAAALVVDYTLTVAVSIAAGVGTLASGFPGLIPDRVPIGLGILALITFLNLRGLGDAARAFLLPTLVFIVGLLTILGIGLIHPLAPHTPAPGRLLLATRGFEPVSILLALKAFSAGGSALTGLEAIAILSAALLVGARGNTLALIPLFAIGVFTGFALAQSGLVVHWRRTRPPHWRQKAFINGLGAVATAIATVIFLLTKFTQGAWVVVLAVPALIW